MSLWSSCVHSSFHQPAACLNSDVCWSRDEVLVIIVFVAKKKVWIPGNGVFVPNFQCCSLSLFDMIEWNNPTASLARFWLGEGMWLVQRSFWRRLRGHSGFRPIVGQGHVPENLRLPIKYSGEASQYTAVLGQRLSAVGTSVSLSVFVGCHMCCATHKSNCWSRGTVKHYWSTLFLTCNYWRGVCRSVPQSSLVVWTRSPWRVQCCQVKRSWVQRLKGISTCSQACCCDSGHLNVFPCGGSCQSCWFVAPQCFLPERDRKKDRWWQSGGILCFMDFFQYLVTCLMAWIFLEERPRLHVCGSNDQDEVPAISSASWDL